MIAGEIEPGSILVPRCTRSRVRKIDELRKQGATWASIASEVHSDTSTVNRWHRVFRLYGEEVFRNG